MPALWAKQSTALTLRIGPILDADGVEYAGAVIGDISITKNGSTAAMAAAATLTYDANGYYSLVTTTANTDTLGALQLSCNKAGYQMPVFERLVVPANVYDAIVLGSDKLQVDAVEMDGVEGAIDTLVLFAAALDQATGQIDSGTMANNTLTAASLAADAVAEIQSGLATQTSVDDLPTNAELAAALAAADDAVLTQVGLVKAVTDKLDTGLVQDGLVYQFTANMLELGPSGGGDATLEMQEEILASIQGTPVIQTPSPNVLGNLVLTQGDTYDGIGNPKAQWTVSTDYTDGWSVLFTIRDEDDVVVYSTAGQVASSTLITVEIECPTGLSMEGCPGQWQGKFDVQLTKNDSVQTIALGVCYINEDQSR